ncbi:MAG: GNVR domain-containing protein, partial [Fibrobacter sp.]|nr:GNVR domain-containing protein [Fibrobacter sp.]
MSFKTQSSGTSETAMKRQLDYYIHLLWRKLWFVLPVSILVLFAYVFLINMLGLTKPKMEAKAILQFDNPDNLSAVNERVGLQPDTKAILIKSRTFIDNIVNKMGLQLHVLTHNRNELFDSVRIASDAQFGKYEIKIKNGLFAIVFTDPDERIKNKTIKTGKISDLSKNLLPGIDIWWTRQYINEPFNTKFRIVRPRDAVDNIVNNLTVKTIGKDLTIMEISLSGKDYKLITDIINNIADDFVEENALTKRSRKDEVIKILEKQLETARSEMVTAEAVFRRYREQNPTVGVQDAFSPPVQIMDLRETEAQLRSSVTEAQSLIDRYSTARDSVLPGIVGEMISFLNKYGTGTSEGLRNQLVSLEQERLMLNQQYSPFHPLVKENMKKINLLGSKTSNALRGLTKQIERKLNENTTRIEKINSELASLPRKELRYSKLQRQYEVNSEIFSSILAKYNEAKIAKAVEIGDIYVVDHAVEPEEKTDPKVLIALTGFGLFLCFTFGFGPVAVVDFFDRTAHTEKDLHRMTDLLVLEAIPVKQSTGKRTKNNKSSIDPKLVTADYSHNYVDETYRSLRTKILLNLHEAKQKLLLVTSMNVGEGKSFTSANLAITMAQQKIPTVLIDGDLRRGVQHRYFNLKKEPGLSNILLDHAPITASGIQPIIQK